MFPCDLTALINLLEKPAKAESHVEVVDLRHQPHLPEQTAKRTKLTGKFDSIVSPGSLVAQRPGMQNCHQNAQPPCVTAPPEAAEFTRSPEQVVGSAYDYYDQYMVTEPQGTWTPSANFLRQGYYARHINYRTTPDI